MCLGSRLASPRPSVMCKNSRKRALSHSPIEYGLDIESLTRSSEGSLHLPPFGTGSRASSNASGSYGHLSAGNYSFRNTYFKEILSLQICGCFHILSHYSVQKFKCNLAVLYHWDVLDAVKTLTVVLTNELQATDFPTKFDTNCCFSEI